jgi:hypothetical protein
MFATGREQLEPLISVHRVLVLLVVRPGVNKHLIGCENGRTRTYNFIAPVRKGLKPHGGAITSTPTASNYFVVLEHLTTLLRTPMQALFKLTLCCVYRYTS